MSRCGRTDQRWQQGEGQPRRYSKALAGQGATTGQGTTAGNRARRQGAGSTTAGCRQHEGRARWLAPERDDDSRTHDCRARRLGRTRQRGKARRSGAGRATTRRLIGGWAGRRLAARARQLEGATACWQQGHDNQTLEGATAGRATTRRRCRARRCKATTRRDGWQMGRARRRARRDEVRAQATRRPQGWLRQMTAVLLEIPMAAASQDKTAALEGGGA